MNTPTRPNDFHAIESRLAARLAGALTARVESLPHDLSERLRFAREQALGRAREARQLALAGNAPARQPAQAGGFVLVGAGARGAVSLGGFKPSWLQRAATVLPLVLLVGGLVMIDRWSLREQVVAAAEFDAQLLSDDLPPAAYSDPGFAEFLRNSDTP